MTDHRLRIPLLDTREMPITGYLDRLSARSGETLSAHVSVLAGEPFTARLQRVISGDPNPSGPGLRFEDLSHRYCATLPGVRQPICPGSHAELPGPDLASDEGATWSALICLTMNLGRGIILEQRAADRSVTIRLTDLGLRAEVSSSGDTVILDLLGVLPTEVWVRVWLSVDPSSRRLTIGRVDADNPGQSAEARLPKGFELVSGGRLIVAAGGEEVASHFTGKIEDPAVYRGSGTPWSGDVSHDRLVARWDFSLSMDTQRVVASAGSAVDGVLRNLPTRAVTGSRWSGNEHAWRHAPDQYGAIHFHEDDYGSCDWDRSFTFDVPDDLRSGAYAFHLTTKNGEDWLPFYVLPPRGATQARVAFLAPTYTYMAYANCYFANRAPEARARSARWGASPYTGGAFGSYGRSTYNWHADGSGVALSSRHRPILTMRPNFVFEDDPKGSGVRHYPADTHLLAWFEDKGIAFDVITDEDLDDEGVALIREYDAVVTGSHPEYHTAGTLDAIAHYVADGGNLAYLGGNGFYWRIARNPSSPEVIEVRRAEGGIRLWAAQPGEYHHQLDGFLGGMWRRARRYPQALVGIGFTAQGPFDATYFRRRAASYDGPAAWIFEGVEEDCFGDYGLSAGGAAGFELDRADAVLGSPGKLHVLATSENPPASFGAVHEEMLTESLTLSGEPAGDLVRADMVYVETPAGGGVFSVGSITFCGSLWDGKRFDGPVSRILENVVRRFSGYEAAADPILP